MIQGKQSKNGAKNQHIITRFCFATRPLSFLHELPLCFLPPLTYFASVLFLVVAEYY